MKVNVYLEGYLAGVIKKVKGGYQYCSSDLNVKGRIHSTLGRCKNSLVGTLHTYETI